MCCLFVLVNERGSGREEERGGVIRDWLVRRKISQKLLEHT